MRKALLLLPLAAAVFAACTGQMKAPDGLERDAAAPTVPPSRPMDDVSDSSVVEPPPPPQSPPSPPPAPPVPPPIDPPGDAGPADPPDACAGALLCDDFEAYAAGGDPGAPWTVSTNGGAIAVDESRAYSGRRSIHFSTEGGDGTYRRAFMQLRDGVTLPGAGGVLYGRMMIFTPEAPPDGVHWTNIQAEGDVPGMGFRALYRYGGMNDKHFMANYETDGRRTDCWQNSDTPFPESRWACVEWRFDSASDRMDLWLDGAPIEDLSVVEQGQGCIAHETDDHWYAATWDTVSLGLERYQTAPTNELWIDDVALSEERIGCPPPPSS